jgi:hypothetical protein
MKIESLGQNQLMDLIDRLYSHPSTITAKEKMALSKYLKATLLGKDVGVLCGGGI